MDDSMPNLLFTHLDTLNACAVDAYERALYRAFAHSPKDSTPDQFIFDRPRKRARCKLAYESQLIFTATQETEVVAGIAANIDPTIPLRVEQMDFKIDRPRSKVCEVLFMFSLLDYTMGIPTLHKLGDFARAQVKDRDIEVIYAAPCSARGLRPYQTSGFSLAEEKIVDGQPKYLVFLKASD